MLQPALCLMLLCSALTVGGCVASPRVCGECDQSRRSGQTGGDSSTRTPAIAVSSPIDAAKLWLVSLRDGNQVALESRTAFPFQVRWAVADGWAGSARDSRSLAELVARLRSDAVFAGEVQHVADFPARLLAVAELPEWASGDLAPATAQAIKSFINGDGVTYEFVLFVAAEGVRAVAVSAAIEGG